MTGAVPVTEQQMVANLVARFRELSHDDEEVLRALAEAGVRRLISERHLEWWGMNEQGEALYVPREAEVVIYVWR